MTTAATIWATAAVGMAVGYGMCLWACLMTLILFGVLAARHVSAGKGLFRGVVTANIKMADAEPSSASRWSKLDGD